MYLILIVWEDFNLENEFYTVNLILIIACFIFMIVKCRTGIYYHGKITYNHQKIVSKYVKVNFKTDFIFIFILLFNQFYGPPMNISCTFIKDDENGKIFR